MTANLPASIKSQLEETICEGNWVEELKGHPVIHSLAQLATGSVGGAFASFIEKTVRVNYRRRN